MADPLAKQLTDIPFTGGLSTKLDSYQIPFNKLAAARDVVFTSPGEIRTRYGYKALSTQLANTNRFGNASIDSGQGLLAYGDELVMCDPLNLYSYDPGSRKWIYKAPCTSMNVTIDDVISTGQGQTAPDQNVSTNGLRFDAWEDGPTGAGGVYYSVTNMQTGTTVVAPTLVHASATKPKVLNVFGRFVLLYIRTDTTRIYMATVPQVNVSAGLTTFALTSPSVADNQLNATYPNYDAVTIPNAGGSPVMYLAFCNSAATTTAGATIFGFASGNLSATPSFIATYASLVPRQLTIFADTIAAGPNSINGPVVVFSTGTAVKAFGYQWTLVARTFNALTLDTATQVVPSITGVSSAQNLGPTVSQSRSVDVYWTVYDALSVNTAIKFVRLIGTTPTLAQPASVHFLTVGLASKAFVSPQPGPVVSYVVVAYQSKFPTAPGFYGLQDTYFVVDSQSYTTARFFSGTAGGLPAYNSGSAFGTPMLPEVTRDANDMAHVALTRADFLTTLGAVGEPPTASTFSRTTPAPGVQAPLSAIFTQDGVVAVTFDFFDSQNSYLSAELGGTLLLGGGLLQSYDGQTLTENDFSLYPENITYSGNSSGGGSIPDGTYWYCFCWEWTNARGEIQRSAPSVPISVAISSMSGTAGAVTFNIPPLVMTAKTNAVLMAYRSILNGVVFQQAIITTIPASSPGTNAPVINTRGGSVTFVDHMTDTLLGSTPNLYTTGLVIENLPTPPCSDLTVNYNRLFALGTERENVVFFSQQTGPGEPVNMSEWLFFNVDPRGGKTTAIRALDQHLIIFKEGLIMAVDGSGPNAIGQNTPGFQEAYIVTTDVGCVYPRSIGMGPEGLYFQSAKGLAHIDRALRVTYIGWEAQVLVNAHEVTSAQLVSYTQQMRFTLSDKTLVGHDYFVNQWFEHTAIDAVDSTNWLGQYAYLRPDGVVRVENPPKPTDTVSEAMATFSDAGAFVGMSIESPWFDMGGLNGWAGTLWAFLLGKVKSRCRLRVGIAYDQDPSVKQTIYVDVAPSAAYGTGTYGKGVYGGGFPDSVWRMQPNQRLANAIKLTVTVVQLDGAIGESVSLSGFSLEWQSSKTPRAPKSSATYG